MIKKSSQVFFGTIFEIFKNCRSLEEKNRSFVPAFEVFAVLVRKNLIIVFFYKKSSIFSCELPLEAWVFIQ